MSGFVTRSFYTTAARFPPSREWPYLLPVIINAIYNSLIAESYSFPAIPS